MDDLETLITINNNPSTDEIYTHIKVIHDLLERHQIKHWLIYGTLLGSVRQQDIIPYDYDFDFGILYEDRDKIVSIAEKELDSKYKVEFTTGTLYSKASRFKKAETKWRVSLKVKYNDTPIGDLYIYYKCNDGFMRRYDPMDKILFWPNSTFPSILVDNLDIGTIRDLKLPIPNNPILLLEHYYGPMWVTPIQASSQDGKNHPNYDYYGGYKKASLKELTNKTIRAFDKVKDILELKPSLKPDAIEFIFPLEHIDWLKENEECIL